MSYITYKLREVNLCGSFGGQKIIHKFPKPIYNCLQLICKILDLIGLHEHTETFGFETTAPENKQLIPSRCY